MYDKNCLEKTPVTSMGATSRTHDKNGLRMWTATPTNVDSGKNVTKKEPSSSISSHPSVDGGAKRSKVY